jgi:hypothetical protein
MHVLRNSLLAIPVLAAIAGCSGLNAPTQPTPQAAVKAPEFLYVGTSNPGLMAFEIGPDGGLNATATSANLSAICSPALAPVPGRIYTISVSCSTPDVPVEFRRLDLSPSGEIVSATGLLSLGPDFPSITDTVLNFLPSPTGKFAYTSSADNDSVEHISLIQIDAAGDLAVKPGLGLSWPLDVSPFGGESHGPNSVVTTQEATFLIVKDWFSSRDTDPAVNYLVYRVDSETGAVGNKVGEAAIGTTSYTSFNTQAGALMVFGELPQNGDPGDLRLFHIGLDGVPLLQRCLADQPACAHPEIGVFHPSGKWLFIVDRVAGGIWTIPVTGNSLSAANASFFPVNLDGSFQFAFSADARSFYMGQWGNVFQPVQTGEILGFQVNDKTGALTPIAGSPWSLGKLDFGIAAMITVAGTGR